MGLNSEIRHSFYFFIKRDQILTSPEVEVRESLIVVDKMSD